VIVHGAAEPQRFRGWIAERLGLHFDDAKLGFLAEVLDRCAGSKGLASQSYLDRLEGPDIEADLRALALELTVPETYFFRHIDQFRAFADVALPEARAAREPVRAISMLSAGCASGEEPYSLAMMVRERGANLGWSVAIRALDINAAMLAKAARGRYSAWALRETPSESQQRWFRSIGREFELEESIRTAVTFQEVNLAEENSELWAPGRYDVIFCRNLLMYFTPHNAQALVARLTRSLAPGGHLFLGHAETLRGLSNDYHLRHTHGTFYYQRKNTRNDARAERTGGEINGAGHGKATPPAAFEAAAPPPEPAWTGTWLETIQHASDRIQTLTDRRAAQSASRDGRGPDGSAQTAAQTAAQTTAQTTAQLPLALELLKKERFSDALELLGRLPPESDRDTDVLLLRAALLTHSGQLNAAENVCAQLLARDELNSGAHYLLALCREGAGDRQGALDHDQAAIYLDPGFAMPRLHLGLMARRAGEQASARAELGDALMLLRREDASRLLLFGGGFGRDALIALCRSELLSAGGTP
jgi:chemotaxis protein methyltransferase CheR